jgi:U3 small nucleolar RNA-associated protein 12
VNSFKDTIGFNLAALQLLQLEIEQRDGVKLFMEATEKSKKKKKKDKQKVEQAYVMTLG